MTNPALEAEEIARLREVNSQLRAVIETQEHRIKALLAALYGPKAETTATLDPGQMALFDEAELTADEAAAEPQVEEVTYQRKKTKGKREADLAGLPTEQVVHELDETERQCPDCREPMSACGREVARRELTVVPAQYRVTEHVQVVYACRPCEKNSHRTPMTKAPVPAGVVKGSGLASASLVADIMARKYVLGLPLYRQEQDLARQDVALSRQTMANWMVYAAQSWLTPLYLAMQARLIGSHVLHADETTVQVLREDGKKAQSKSYMWLYRTSGDTDQAIVVYDYQPDRRHRRPADFLKGYTGYLHADGYEAYHHLAGVTVVGCWAHVRRKFTDQLKAAPSALAPHSVPATGLAWCNRMFAIERDLADLTPKDRHAQRLERLAPVMDEFFTWAEQTYGTGLATTSSAIGKALAYALGQRPYLRNVLRDGRLELSNNRAERSIKPFVIGRKNWLFANSAAGADASAIIYSIIETAKENGLKPFEYLKYVFTTAPNVNLTDPAAIDALLPWNAPAHCRAITKPEFDTAA